MSHLRACQNNFDTVHSNKISRFDNVTVLTFDLRVAVNLDLTLFLG